MTDEYTSALHRQQQRPLHLALVFTRLLSGISPLGITPALAAISACAAWPWREPSLQIAAGVASFTAVIIDWISLSLLPRQGRSFGPVTPPLLGLALLRATTTFLIGAIRPTWTAFGFAVGIQLAITASQLYATWIEPFRVSLTRLDLRSPKLVVGTSLQVLQLSDIHFEGWTPREREVIRIARDLKPDLILLTGDYLNLSAVDNPDLQRDARQMLTQIAELAPTYAITGSLPVDRPDIVPGIFADLPMTWLMNDVLDIQVGEETLRLVGMRCSRERALDAPRLNQLLEDQTSEEHFTILLYHSPDLMPEAAEHKIDLYLAGHTHGGQLRLPFFGALITSSEFGKRYEAGQYNEEATTLYVSRGLGMEGYGAPRARFLAPPEIVLLQISNPQGE